MTQNEILVMLHKVVAENQQFTTWTVSTPHLVALVNQAIEKEREECARICEAYLSVGLANHMAALIRTREETR